MQRDAARRLIKQTFEQPFDKEQYKVLTKNLLNGLEDAPFAYRGSYVFADFRDYIDSLERIGKYEDPDGNKLDVLIVRLKKTTSLERARATQRRFVAKYLKGSRGDVLKDAALVAFVSPSERDWRFSYVRMDYRIETTERGKIKVQEEFTPARRYSFLVGENENSHTAQSRLLPILETSDHSPRLSALEEAFSVEQVTREFFEQYRRLFHEIKEALEKLIKSDQNIRKDFTEKGVESEDFAKKLLGQIVFLYFLQKKGWFGVAKNASWGSGPKNFLRQLFDEKHGKYDNFFDEILEALFYNTLAVERTKDYADRFGCRIPFLNGGLFDPLNDYDWIGMDILLPNDLFSNSVKTKEGDVGTGVLDVFDRYNFTVKEDEPLEKEVAVDPEMLGKVFENLLEAKERRSSGTYYTPREVVHYMCQESLVNYLDASMGHRVTRDDIEILVRHGDTVIENELRVKHSGRETKDYSYKLPESIRQHARILDDALADIKVCDPAVGSGAFLVGMMTEVVRARDTLSNVMSAPVQRSAYEFKRHAIHRSLFGVDVDLGAVEISKLRLWLSLIVDEDDYTRIRPLPNLDYKIMQGNSLFEEYEGIKLFDERILDTGEDVNKVRARLTERQRQLEKEYVRLHQSDSLSAVKKTELEKGLKELERRLRTLGSKSANGSQVSLGIFGPSGARRKSEELLELQKRFFEAYHKRDKDQLRSRIDELMWELICASLEEQNKTGKIDEVREFRRTKTQPFFLWKLNFADVFQARGGFDIVIGNPPYIRIQNLSAETATQLKKFYNSAIGKFDIYVCFIERGFTLLNQAGVLCFINPNKFLMASYGKGIRTFLNERQAISSIVDFGDSQVFEGATNYTCILELSKAPVKQVRYISVQSDSDFVELSRSSVEFNRVDLPLPDGPWVIQGAAHEKLQEKMRALGTLGDYCEEIFQGLISGGDKLFYLERVGAKGASYRGRSKLDDSVYEFERGLCFDLLKGSDVKRYETLSPRYIVVFPYCEATDGRTVLLKEAVLKRDCPKAYSYLRSFRSQLRDRGSERMEYESWYALWCPRSIEKFRMPKLVTQVLASRASYTLDRTGTTMFVGGGNAGVYGIIPKSSVSLEYLLALLNSKLLDYVLRSKSTQFRGGYYSYAKRFIEGLPIVIPSEEKRQRLERLAQKALRFDADVARAGLGRRERGNIEKEIDSLVYELYGLTGGEIDLVEHEFADKEV